MKRIFALLSFALLSFGMNQQSSAQIFNTKLKITVVDELGNVIQDAKVTLYATEEAYTQEVNPVQEFQLTDKKGVVTFKGLNRKEYYVRVVKGELTNAGGGEIVSGLEPKKLNKANVVISEF
ncbi:MAG TPA: carboxypeptidase-like regulatory domain-containing protein [Roseivirga sp.]